MSVRDRIRQQSKQYYDDLQEVKRLDAEAINTLTNEVIEVQRQLIDELEERIEELEAGRDTMQKALSFLFERLKVRRA